MKNTPIKSGRVWTKEEKQAEMKSLRRLEGMLKDAIKCAKAKIRSGKRVIEASKNLTKATEELTGGLRKLINSPLSKKETEGNG